MPKTSFSPTTARNLEPKFDAREDVLDYFDLHSAKVVTFAKKTDAKPERHSAKGRTQSIGQLKRAVKIAERIQRLEGELISILGTVRNREFANV